MPRRESPKRHINYEDKDCEVCGKQYHPTSPRQRWCSAECAQKSTKKCPECGEVKTTTDFYLRNGFPGGYCKPCNRKRAKLSEEKERREKPEQFAERRRKAVRAYRERHPERVREQVRWNKKKCKYGVTRERYEQMVADQDGKCAICGVTENRYGDTVRDWDIDHCHDTGEVRGLLCTNCNRGIGYMQHDADRLQAAIGYLKCSESSSSVPTVNTDFA